jgi:multimeric flavodoxin WrbA/putative sterol carrier protein
MKNIVLNVGLWPSTVIFWVMLEAVGVGLVWSAAAALLYLGIFYAWALAVGDGSKLELAGLLFFLVGLGLALLSPRLGRAWLQDFFAFFLFSLMFLMAVLPAALGGEPFTMAIARRTTPEMFWGTPQFAAINRIMTQVWSGLFLVAALTSLFGGYWLGLLAPVALVLVVGLPFNAWFPNYYMRRQGMDGMLKTPAASPEISPAVATVAPKPEALTASQAMEIGPSPSEKAAELDPAKKVLVLMGSPRGPKGQTHRCLTPFVQGMEEAGAEVEIVYLKDLKIKPCVGCFTCWEKTPGVCVHKNDDMPALLEKMKAADTWVWAVPLYVFNIPGMAKNALDRFIPLLEPHMVRNETHGTNHPHRWQGVKRAVLLSVCGFPELGQFDSLRVWFRQVYNRGTMFRVAGEVLRPNAEALNLADRGLISVASQVMDAFRRAGRELVEQGRVSAETEAAVTVDLFADNEAWRRVVNQRWDLAIQYWEDKRAGREVPDDVNEYCFSHPALILAGMSLIFQPQEAQGIQGDIQFDVTGEPGGWYFLRVGNGTCRYHEGRSDAPILTVHTPWDVWWGITEGRINGQDAFMQGSYKAEGDLSVLMRLNSMFKTVEPDQAAAVAN